VSTAERFLLDVPDVWDEMDMTGESMARTRAEALARAESPRDKAQINDLFRQARQVTNSARSHGALFASGTATMYDEGLFMAYVMVFAVTTPEGLELTLPVISAQLGVDSASGKAPSDRVISSASVLNVGRVARVTGTEVTPLTADVKVKLLTMHTMMPVPGTARDFLVVSCASPNLPMKNEVYDLFDAVTGTFRFVSAEGKVVSGDH
jgi:hypothetical protein